MQQVSVCAALALLLFVTTLSAHANDLPSSHPVAPIVPGFARLQSAGHPDAIASGRLLLGELLCIRCHQPDSAQESFLTHKAAPVLDDVASRVQRNYIKKFLNDPQAAKPGTTMPQMFAGMAESDKQRTIEALVQFLASTGPLRQERMDRRLIAGGRGLYHRVGCVACHGTRDAAGNADKTIATSVPLGDLNAKYSLGGLRAFLEDPQHVRPSGRMPGLLDGEEARQVAHYLLQGTVFAALPPNMTYAYYEGDWEMLPEFEQLKPIATGQVAGFDLSAARRINNMAMRFEGYLRIDHEDDYRFHLMSDDGSKLFLDDKLVVNNDGIHPPTTLTGSTHLTPGMHKLVAAVFNSGGGVDLDVEIEGPRVPRQPITDLISLTRAGHPKKRQASAEKTDENSDLQPELVARGRELFGTLGCSNCHTMTVHGRIIEAKRVTPSLPKLRPSEGCLGSQRRNGVPWYALGSEQRAALVAAVKAPTPRERPNPREVIAQNLNIFNCYACHERDKAGGVDEALNSSFASVQPEMGDEGRIPPSLNGVGAKLSSRYLRQILDRGSKDRPYMYTRMPRFGDANVGRLVQAFEAVDTLPLSPKVTFHEPSARVKADARNLVSGQSLGCVKCHTFAGHQAEGIQAIDLTLLPHRLRREWFHYYLLNPQGVRPGTRMPAAWPNGKTFYADILEGSTTKQIEGMWIYLSDGSKAQVPPGMNKQSIPLVPDTRAIIYRNFIEGAGPRAIAVGYPEKAHLAFDANYLRLAVIWQGAFIDAARHWTDRGEGFEPPLGDNILRLPTKVSFAILTGDDEPWPSKRAKELGFKFRGYVLADDERPTFHYSHGDIQIADFPNALAGKSNEAPSIQRTLTVTSPTPVANLFFLAAAANKIEAASDGLYKIDGEWKLRIQASSSPRIRRSDSKMELLVPVRFQNGRATIVQDFMW